MNFDSPDDAREYYRPDDIRVLFVGESPPAGGTFFYFANSKLYRATKEAFECALPQIAEREFLDVFKRLCCYLDDLCAEPVNHLALDDPERLAARADGVRPLAERVAPMRPPVVTIVMKAIVPDVEQALVEARCEDVERASLPFPGRPQHYKRFVDELALLVTDWQRRGIFCRL